MYIDCFALSMTCILVHTNVRMYKSIMTNLVVFAIDTISCTPLLYDYLFKSYNVNIFLSTSETFL